MTTIDKIAQRARRTTFLAAKNLYWHIRPGDTHRRLHLFVAGVQRSGTNMLMDILEKSWIIDAYHERDERAFDNYKMRELPVIERLASKSPFPVFAIKSLFELQELPELMHHFPPAKALWIVRDYNDTVNSTLKSFSRHLVDRINRAVKPGNVEWLGAGMSDETRQLLTPFVHPEMEPADAAAIQWYLRNVLFFEMEFDANPNVLTISYEKLVTEPADEIGRICEFIEVPYVSRLSQDIFSSSIGKRNKPPIQPAVKALCDGLKERFEPLTSS